MNTLKILAVVSTAFVAFAAAPYASSADRPTSGPDHAATAQDHQAKAAAANRKAAAHEVMARAGGSPKGNSQAMANHCEGLIAQAKAEAAEHAAKAAEHRGLADAQAATLTAEQHLAAARDLETKAAAAHAKALEHEKMARTGGAPKDDGQSMENHCGQLVMQYRAQAESYSEQAAEHKRLAAAK